MGANGEAGSNTVAEEEDLGATIVWLKELPAAAKLVSLVLEAPMGPFEARRGLLLLGDSKSPL